jgi:hypothetical protein
MLGGRFTAVQGVTPERVAVQAGQTGCGVPEKWQRFCEGQKEDGICDSWLMPLELPLELRLVCWSEEYQAVCLRFASLEGRGRLELHLWSKPEWSIC